MYGSPGPKDVLLHSLSALSYAVVQTSRPVPIHKVSVLQQELAAQASLGAHEDAHQGEALLLRRVRQRVQSGGDTQKTRENVRLGQTSRGRHVPRLGVIVIACVFVRDLALH